VDDLKILVRRVRDWSDADSQRAEHLAQTLSGVVGAQPTRTRHTPTGPDAGTRAFVGREGAALASALDRAAKVLEQQPLAHDPLQAVLNVMQPLRGLASLADLPPMQDLLEGIEQAIAETTRSTTPVPGAAEVFAAAARSLSNAARAVAADGRANVDAPEVHEFTERLGKLLGLDPSVVPIEALYHQDAGPHVVERGTPPAHRAKLGEVELVSHGERLKQVADAIDRAGTPAQRLLRAYGLAGTFRALSESGGGPLAIAAAEFVRSARNALSRGTTADAEGLARQLREAGAVLSTAAHGQEDALAQRLSAVSASLSGRAPAPPPAAAPAPVPVAAPPPAPAPAPVPAPVGESTDLAGSYATYQAMVDALGLKPASLDELLSGPPAMPAPVRAADQPAAAASDTLPSIADFCYRGSAALERALSLKTAIHAALASGDGREQAGELLDEVFDLIQLGLSDA
jgi:hypothetical protein